MAVILNWYQSIHKNQQLKVSFILQCISERAVAKIPFILRPIEEISLLAQDQLSGSLSGSALNNCFKMFIFSIMQSFYHAIGVLFSLFSRKQNADGMIEKSLEQADLC